MKVNENVDENYMIDRVVCQSLGKLWIKMRVGAVVLFLASPGLFSDSCQTSQLNTRDCGTTNTSPQRHSFSALNVCRRTAISVNATGPLRRLVKKKKKEKRKTNEKTQLEKQMFIFMCCLAKNE